MVEVLFSLGSNLGDRTAHLQAAVGSLAEVIQLSAISSIYQTVPWGYSEQPDFLNMVMSGETDLSPQELLIHLKKIETALGRRPTFRYGPRQIDIDILAYGDLTLKTEKLTIPHPQMHRRAFVLVPLAEIAPQWVHPLLELNIGELLTGMEVDGVRRWQPDG